MSEQSGNIGCLSIRDLNLPDSITSFYEKRSIRTLLQWQSECILTPDVMSGASNLVYSAPTSAGKTLVAELLLLKRLLSAGNANRKVLFILPYVAVSREKYIHLQALLRNVGKTVGLFAGGAQQGASYTFESVDVAVCTIEKANSFVCRLIEERRLTEQVCMVVVDELHLLKEGRRGFLLELLLSKMLYCVEQEAEGSQVGAEHLAGQKQSDGVRKAVSASAIQLVGMSATLPDLDRVAHWLRARLFVTSVRPVPLRHFFKLASAIYDERLQVVRTLMPIQGPVHDEDQVGQLCLETLDEGHSVLVFCPTKKRCEALASSLARLFTQMRSRRADDFAQWLATKRHALEEQCARLRMLEAGADPVLAATLPAAVAFHHAGLTGEERELVETAFRAGLVRVVCATSTLASGVNLPARRVIIRSPRGAVRDAPMLDAGTYQQMAGRAGRQGYDACGEAFTLCASRSELEHVSRLLHAQPDPGSAAAADWSSVEQLARACLEMVGTGCARSTRELLRYFTCSFSAARLDDLHCRVHEAVAWLQRSGLIREETARVHPCPIREESNDGSNSTSTCRSTPLQEHKPEPVSDTRLLPTSLGVAVLTSNVSIPDGLAVYAALQTAKRSLVLANDLHLVYLVTPVYCELMNSVNWRRLAQALAHLDADAMLVARTVGVDDVLVGRLGALCDGDVDALRRRLCGPNSRSPLSPSEFDQRVHVAKRFFLALLLYDLIDERPLADCVEQYQVAKGTVQQFQQAACSFSSIVTSFARALGYVHLEALFAHFQTRIAFGVRRELADLMRLASLNARRARFLYDAGLRTCAAIARSSRDTLAKLIRRASPFELDRRTVPLCISNVDGQLRVSANGNVKDRPFVMFVPGRLEPLDEFEIADRLLAEAQDVIRAELLNLGIEPAALCADTKLGWHSISHPAPASNDVVHPIKLDLAALIKVPSLIGTETTTSSNVDSGTDSRSVTDTVSSSNTKTNPCVPTTNLPNTAEPSSSSAVSATCVTDTRTSSSSCGCEEAAGNSPCSSQSASDEHEDKEDDLFGKDKSDSLEAFQFATQALLEGFTVSSAANAPTENSTVLPIAEYDSNENAVDMRRLSADAVRRVQVANNAQRSLNAFNCENDDFFLPVRRPDGNTQSADQRASSTPQSDRRTQPPISTAAARPANDAVQFAALTGSPIVQLREAIAERLVNASTSAKNATSNSSLFGDDSSLFALVNNTSELERQCNLTSQPREPAESVAVAQPAVVEAVQNQVLRFELSDLNEDSLCKLGEVGPLADSEKSTSSSSSSSIVIRKRTRIDSPRSATKSNAIAACATERVTLTLVDEDDANLEAFLTEWGRQQRFAFILVSSDSNREGPLSVKPTANSIFQRLFADEELNDTASDVGDSESEDDHDSNAGDTPVSGARAAQAAFAAVCVCWNDAQVFAFRTANVFACCSHLSLLRAVLQNPNTVKITADVKYAYVHLKRIGITLCSVSRFTDALRLDSLVDVSAIFWLLDPEGDTCTQLKTYLSTFPDVLVKCRATWKNEYRTQADCARILKGCPDLNDAFATCDQHIFEPQTFQMFTYFTYSYFFLYSRLLDQLKALQLFDTYRNIELPNLFLLGDIELAGIGFNLTSFRAQRAMIDHVLNQLASKIYAYTNGRPFRVTSNNALASFLYDTLKLPKLHNHAEARRNPHCRNGRERIVRKKDLESLAALHPAVPLVVLYRRTHLMRSHALRALEREALKHAPVRDAVVTISGTYDAFSATGRMILNRPNLQNLPKEMLFDVDSSPEVREFLNSELGRCITWHCTDETHLNCAVRMRDSVCARERRLLVAADYNQLELRVLAHLSKDENLLRLFNQQKQDVFRLIAAEFMNKTLAHITDEERQQAKQLCYGLVYGMGAKSLARSLNVSDEHAKTLVTNFKSRFPGIDKFFQSVIQQCRAHSYVTTLFGRRRYLRKINYPNPAARANAERQAINTTIQGSASDLVKLATIRLCSAVENHPVLGGYTPDGSRKFSIVLQIHDELICEVCEEFKDLSIILLRDSLEKLPMPMYVDFPVKVRVGTSWATLIETN